MKVVILAGGKGTRLRELTGDVPKPMIDLLGKPIIEHIIDWYHKFGCSEFYVCAGYKKEEVFSYFSTHYSRVNGSGSVEDGYLERYRDHTDGKYITVLDTGLETETGGRLGRLRNLISEDETFMLTYGDGLSDINISRLVDFHSKHSSSCTLSAFQPRLRYGLLALDGDVIQGFEEKPRMKEWSNCGYMILHGSVFNSIQGDADVLEKDLLPKLAARKEIRAFKHSGFFKAIDTYKELLEAEELLKETETFQ